MVWLFPVEAAAACIFEEEAVMSQHASLRSANKIMTKRNVLKRFERVDLLQERGKWKPGDRGLGLPKTKALG